MEVEHPLGWVPGLAVLAAVGILARAVGAVVPFVEALAAAVAVGAVAGNLLSVPETLQRGIDQYKLLLEVGIVLLGASIPLDRVVASGGTVTLLVVGTVAFGVVLVETIGRVGSSLAPRSRSLLAAGASICGVSAVVAVGSSIEADDEMLAYVAGTVLLFDAVTLVTFPILGGVLGLSDRVFGVWAGLAMFSTGPVAAAGFSVSAVAGQWATLTKLVRNAFIGVLSIGYAVAYSTDPTSGGTGRFRALWRQFPKFLVGFLLVVAVVNAGLLSPAGVAAVERLSEWLFVIAFAGVGFAIRVDEMRRAGLAPVGILLVYLLVVSTLTLSAVSVLL